jgi:hypothetical protein
LESSIIFTILVFFLLAFTESLVLCHQFHKKKDSRFFMLNFALPFVQFVIVELCLIHSFTPIMFHISPSFSVFFVLNEVLGLILCLPFSVVIRNKALGISIERTLIIGFIEFIMTFCFAVPVYSIVFMPLVNTL